MAHPWRFPWLILGAALMVMGTTLNVKAGSENIFPPYQQEIQDNLPPGMQMRLPSQVMMNHPSNGEENYRVRVFSFTSPKGLMVSLFSCDSGSPSCLVGSFSADSQRSVDAQAALKQHQTGGAPITLAQGVRGYLWEGARQNPPSPFSSVMWEQDGQIYTVRLRVQPRQSLLYMAGSMANAEPIVGAVAAGVNQPEPPPVLPRVSPSPTPVSEETLVALKREPEGSGASEGNPRNSVSASLGANASGQATSTSTESSEQWEECRLDYQPEMMTKPPLSIPVTVEGNPGLVEVKGSTIFDADTITTRINPIIQRLEAGSLTATEFSQEISNAITQLYLENHYITSKTDIPENRNGIWEFNIIEGGLQSVQIEGRQRLNLAYICSRIKLAAGIPLNANRLEEQLRLLGVSPHLENVEASLRSTGNEGKSVLIVRVREVNPFGFNWNIDNYSPPSVGSERLGMGFRYLNLTGVGDILTGSYRFTTTGGADIFDFTYQMPVNPMEGAFLLRVAPNRNEITQSPFDELGIQGETELYEIGFRQPLVRTPREEFALSLRFAFQEGQTFVFDELPTPFGIGPDEDGVSRTSVFKLGQDYIHRDIQGAWSLRSQFSLGTGLFNATTNPGSIPDGQFVSWLGQVQRVQQLSENNFLIIQGDVQLTPDSLLPSQQFVIGGGQSLRGYRQNARTGDNGFRFSIENRITIERDAAGEPEIQIAPFLDLGMVWNVEDDLRDSSDQKFLGGVGLGLLWEGFLDIEELSLRLDYALPLIELDDRGENAQDEGFYFNINYQPKW